MNKNIFKQVEFSKPKRNAFDLTHTVSMSGEFGWLYPILNLEVVPGDTAILAHDVLTRFAPMLAPVMNRYDVFIHDFFVPYRIIWDGWEEFIVGDEEALRVMPTVEILNSASSTTKKFLDYFGIKPIEGGGLAQKVNALHFAAYQKIYNEYYRDQNLIDPVEDELVDGANVITDFCVLRRRAWEHDYFTSALPFAQKGASVDLPLGNIVLKEDWRSIDTPNWVDENLDPRHYNEPLINADVAGDVQVRTDTGSGYFGPLAYDPKGSLETQATTINDLRRAFKLQEWLEKNARGGTRYTEALRVHFGVISDDARLQRPEYINGVKAPVIISEVLNSNGVFNTFNGTEWEETGSPQGSMAGHGVAVAHSGVGKYYSKEFGVIISILSVMPKASYQDGIPKNFLKSDFLDYYFPSFAHLGEQPILNKEIWAYGAQGDDIFGYTPRYAEYKYHPSRVAGDFRNSLKFWTGNREFSSQPNLNQRFIECYAEDVDSIWAVQSGDHLWMSVLNKIKMVRPMPYFGSPSI